MTQVLWSKLLDDGNQMLGDACCIVREHQGKQLSDFTGHNGPLIPDADKLQQFEETGRATPTLIKAYVNALGFKSNAAVVGRAAEILYENGITVPIGLGQNAGLRPGNFLLTMPKLDAIALKVLEKAYHGRSAEFAKACDLNVGTVNRTIARIEDGGDGFSTTNLCNLATDLARQEDSSAGPQNEAYLMHWYICNIMPTVGRNSAVTR